MYLLITRGTCVLNLETELNIFEKETQCGNSICYDFLGTGSVFIISNTVFAYEKKRKLCTRMYVYE